MKNHPDIFIVGSGYVGLANGIALAEKAKVTFIDIDQDKINDLNKGVSPLKEKDLVINCEKNKKNITATCDLHSIKEDSYIILALPTNYDPETNNFDTKVLEETTQKILKITSGSKIIIKSTVPIGFTKKLRARHSVSNIYFSPEFLREGRSFFDAVNPDRVIVGPADENTESVANILMSAIQNRKKTKCMVMGSDEAEAVKLFANTYLAMRVAYFNEIDGFCFDNMLDTKSVIDGVSRDIRIGEGYNNPSFGYGGYCLPKDTKQAKASMKDTPEKLFTAIVESNDTRLEHLSRLIQAKNLSPIGVYRMNMKINSDNTRDSSTFMLLSKLAKKGNKILIYEPLCDSTHIKDLPNAELVSSVEELLRQSKIVLSNRMSEDLKSFEGEVFSRDVYNDN
mgnify:CR=1 FL=1